MASRTDQAAFGRTDLVVLAAITVLAAVLRLYRLGEWSLWVDEAHTFRDVTATSEAFWQSGTSRYPLAYLMLRGLLAVGLLPTTGEGWLRLPFAFCGILSVPVIAVFGRTLVGRRAALLAALMLAVFPWHLYWSQNARGYSLVMLLAMLGAFAFHGGITHRSILWAVIGVVTVVLSGLTHPSGFELMAALCVYLGLEARRDPALRARVLRPSVLILIAVVGVLVASQAWPSILRAMEKKSDASIAHLTDTFAWYLRPTVAIATLAGLIWMRHTGLVRTTSLLGTWIGVPLFALIVLGGTVTKVTAQVRPRAVAGVLPRVGVARRCAARPDRVPQSSRAVVAGADPARRTGRERRAVLHLASRGASALARGRGARPCAIGRCRARPHDRRAEPRVLSRPRAVLG